MKYTISDYLNFLAYAMALSKATEKLENKRITIIYIMN